ncbi:MAG TPA: SDR family oxidoreductase [Anaerolineaceae bacterium]|nr:SDR family oxidoreductase [Anaerolineaceae bacterium]
MTTDPSSIRPIACITGASSGIGAAFARRLAPLGYDLILVARRVGLLEELSSELRCDPAAQVEILPVDLAGPGQLAGLEERLRALERLELLVNNAGFGTQGSFLAVSVEDADRMIDVHVRASVRLARAALPGMVQRGRGAVINVASLAGLLPIPGSVTYSATKAYLIAFSEALSMELAGTGVRVQALCPGLTHTGFHEAMGSIPRYTKFELLWMSADAVAASSLAALRRGAVVHVPGLINSLMLAAARLFPRAWYRALAGRAVRHVVDI